jgi:hypothetical protein
MASYYIQTHQGPKGPYSADVIRKGVQEGRIPANAQLHDANTGHAMLAAAVASEPAPQDSGPAIPIGPAGPRPTARSNTCPTRCHARPAALPLRP